MGSRLEEQRQVAFPVTDQPAFDLAALRLKGIGRIAASKDIAWDSHDLFTGKESINDKTSRDGEVVE